jgi:transposase
LRGWAKQAAIDAGERLGVSTSAVTGIRHREAENRELMRANEILLVASSFSAWEHY